jgi:hypothetical protein
MSEHIIDIPANTEVVITIAINPCSKCDPVEVPTLPDPLVDPTPVLEPVPVVEPVPIPVIETDPVAEPNPTPVIEPALQDFSVNCSKHVFPNNKLGFCLIDDAEHFKPLKLKLSNSLSMASFNG